MTTKELCIERLNSLVRLMEQARGNDNSGTYFATKAEGFLDGLLYAGVLETDEYLTLGAEIADKYLNGLK